MGNHGGTEESRGGRVTTEARRKAGEEGWPRKHGGRPEKRGGHGGTGKVGEERVSMKGANRKNGNSYVLYDWQ